MNLNRINPGTIALFVAGTFVFAVGRYTANGGFQLAGGLILLVAVILVLQQVRNS